MLAGKRLLSVINNLTYVSGHWCGVWRVWNFVCIIFTYNWSKNWNKTCYWMSSWYAQPENTKLLSHLKVCYELVKNCCVVFLWPDLMNNVPFLLTNLPAVNMHISSYFSDFFYLSLTAMMVFCTWWLHFSVECPADPLLFSVIMSRWYFLILTWVSRW